MNSQVEYIVAQLFSKIADGTSPAEIAELFSEKVDFYVAGDVDHVSWIGKKNGKEGVAAFYSQIAELIESIQFNIEDTLIKENRAIVLGNLVSLVKKTNNVITTDFAFDIIVKDGKIIRYRMFEDSFAVSEAVK